MLAYRNRLDSGFERLVEGFIGIELRGTGNACSGLACKGNALCVAPFICGACGKLETKSMSTVLEMCYCFVLATACWMQLWQHDAQCFGVHVSKRKLSKADAAACFGSHHAQRLLAHSSNVPNPIWKLKP